MAGLSDSYRKGKPVVITEIQKNKVIQLACSKPEGGYSNWSQVRIAKEVESAKARYVKY